MITRCVAVVVVAVLAMTQIRAETHASIGVGTGLPYGSPVGGLGAGIDFGRYVGLLGGVGPGADAIWAAGIRIYARSPNVKWRPHVSLLGWPEGYGIYAGTDHDVGEPGKWFLTYGLGVGRVNLEAPVGLLFGVGRRF